MYEIEMTQERIDKMVDKRTLLFTYEGDMAGLVSGEKYSRQDLAKAFNVSFPFICSRLKGHTIATDALFLSPKAPKLIMFAGEHDKLSSGKSYTFKQLGAVCGLGSNAMTKRLDGRPQCTPHDVRIRGESHRDSTASSATFSGRWLKRKLV
jgi:hypothetical protein